MRLRTAVAAILAVAAAPTSPGHTLAALDVARAFGTVGAWRITVTQGPDEPDPIGSEGTVPGVVRPCLSRDGGRTCQPDLLAALREPGDDATSPFDEPHELQRLTIVQPRPALPLLLMRVASLSSGDGDQLVATLLLRYDRASDRFVPAFHQIVGRNNNQEVRYIDAGPLHGAVIGAEPTSDAPFGFWITVDRLDAGGRHHPVLRYRSATRYGDGNSLAVIDSEMPGIERRLGFWHPGLPLPHPATCPAPRLIGAALWCAPRPHR